MRGSLIRRDVSEIVTALTWPHPVTPVLMSGMSGHGRREEGEIKMVTSYTLT